MQIKKRKLLFFIFLALSIAWLGFIFSNSLDSGAESTVKSSSVTKFVNDVLHALGYKGEIAHSTVRTLAHFTEFAILGVLVCLTLFLAPRRVSPLLCPAICLVCASLDELLQKFSDGRAMQLSDVCIDTLGAITGTLVVTLSYLLISYICKKKKTDSA